MGLLKAYDDIEYWKYKWVQLKIENEILSYDIKELTENKNQRDSTEVANLKETIKILENEHAVSLTNQKQQFESKIWELEDRLKRKDEVIDGLKATVESLNTELNSQNSEETMIRNILSLPDQNSMIRFMYRAQVIVNNQIFDNLVRSNQIDQKLIKSENVILHIIPIIYNQDNLKIYLWNFN